MRELLQRWAAAEPERLKNLYDQAFRFDMGEYDHSIYYLYNDLSPVDLAWIHWATQQAIIARGWSFELNYLSVLGSYDAEVTLDEHYSFSRNGDNPAEALLAAYLAALEQAN